MTVKIKAEVRDKWADALTSGKYKQTKGVLARLDDTGKPVGFCCLGVLCDVAVKEGVIPPPTVTVDGRDQDVFEYGTEDEFGDGVSYTSLPPAVARWAGLWDQDEGGFVGDPTLVSEDRGYGYSASNWNDNEGATFEHIAAMVRALPVAEDAEVSA